eukprot:GILJ01002352.1.p1 GENE.GILJ01002352.1~~GILJ01002352.1.p1  ORF type:complete len:570 (+),score=97.05 GILJ01002352.1:35-1711(+)
MDVLESTVEISVSCRDLKNKDLFSKSDPCVVLEVKQSNGAWTSYGRTETINDNLNPDFAKSFLVQYCFEEVQVMRFRVFDIDNASATLDDDDFLGECNVTLGELMGARGQQLVRPLLERGRAHGSIIIRGEQVAACREQLMIHFTGTKIEKKDGWFGKSDPYLTISRVREDGVFQKVHQTEVCPNTLTPKWKEFQVPVQKLCNGDLMRPLLIQCWDWDSDGTSDYIGEFQTTVQELLTGPKREFMAVNAANKKNKKYVHSGLIQVVKCQMFTVPTFLDYIAGGCELNLIVAIDFTGSNGDPNHPNSLHFRNPMAPNEYARSVMAVGEILLPYDSDGNIPVYGFGAVVPHLGTATHHCFPLTFNYQQPEVPGVAGLLNAYNNAINCVRLSGPTIFSQVLDAAMNMASQYVSQAEQKYFILLIITDGVINDMDATVARIVSASSLPLSIVIVGVGSADFEGMKMLDGDDGRLRDGAGRYVERDIVQFVAFREYGAANWAKLTKDTLAEIPSQLTSYMAKRGFVPNPPIPPPQVVIAPQPVPVASPTMDAPSAPQDAAPAY